MSKIKLDLSQFKHVKSDDHTTVLEHKKGKHQLTLIHKALSPESQAQLSALSKASPQLKAEGGKVDKNYLSQVKAESTADGMKEAKQRADLNNRHGAAILVDKNEGPNLGKVIKKAEGGDVEADEVAEKFKKNIEGINKPSVSDQQGTKQCPPKQAPPSEDMKMAPKMAEGGKICGECGQPHKYAEGGQAEDYKALDELAKDEPQSQANQPQTDQSQQVPGLTSEPLPVNMKPDYMPGVSDYQPHVPDAQEQQAMGLEDKKRMLAQAQASPNFTKFQPNRSEEQQQNDVVDKAERLQSNQNADAQQRATEAQQPSAQDRINKFLGQGAAPQDQQQEVAPPVKQPQQPQAPQSTAPSQGLPSSGGGKQMPDYMNPAKIAQDLNIENDNWKQDLTNGHIKPETYQSMYAKQDTLGKFGTLFGMLVSGIGSGITGQPNAVISMMDKVIDNDLNAQKQSKTNAFNFLNMEREHQMNKAQIGHMNAQTAASQYELAKAKMQYTAVHNEYDRIMKLPEGPQKQQQLQTLGMVLQGFDQKNMDMNAVIGSKEAMLGGLMNPQSGQDPESGFANQMQKMKMMGMKDQAEDMEKHHIPGIAQRANRPVDPKDITELKDNKRAQDLLNEALNFKQQHPGASWHPTDRAKAETLMANLGDAVRQSTGAGVFKASEMENIKNQIGHSPADFMSALTTNPKLQQTLKKVQGDYNALVGSYIGNSNQNQSKSKINFSPLK